VGSLKIYGWWHRFALIEMSLFVPEPGWRKKAAQTLGDLYPADANRKVKLA
jgi:hypothetical protein